MSREVFALEQGAEPPRASRRASAQPALIPFREAALKHAATGRLSRSRFHAPLISYFRDTPISEIDEVEIVRAAEKLYRGKSDGTKVRQVWTPVIAILRSAGDKRRFGRPSAPAAPDPRDFTAEERARLLPELAEHILPFILLLDGTGCRFHEGLRVQWNQLDLVSRMVRFRKRGLRDSRRMPLTDDLVEALEHLPHREGPVFLTQLGRPYSIKECSGGEIKTTFATACRHASITNLKPRDLRPAWALRQLDSGCSLSRLMELGGWADTRIPAQYLAFLSRRRQENAPVEATPVLP